MRRRARVTTAIAVGALTAAGLAMSASSAQAAPRPRTSPAATVSDPSAAHSYKPAACAAPQPDVDGIPVASCTAVGVVNPTTRQFVVRADAPAQGALGPTEIQSAYDLKGLSGGHRTVAIVDAGGYAHAEADLAVFRSYYGLPACTTANGCFTKLDQNGGTDYPADDPGWSIETALDLDAVSSACPDCNILLVEGNTADSVDLGEATDTAASQPNVVAISNSYGIVMEDPAETTYDTYYNHPGIAVTASSGDDGNVQNWPATSPYVVAVGGTKLTQDDSARGWTESAWDSGGSGCSYYEPEPAFQASIDTGCGGYRAISDIAADADPASGLGIYNTTGQGGWSVYGGTSLASPLVAAMYALAGTQTPGTYAVDQLYADPSLASDLNDVTSGVDGGCGTLLCEAGPGWDGPTGLGTPHGVGALAGGPTGTIAGHVTEDGKPLAGATVDATDAVGTKARAVTDSTGAYRLTVPPGDWSLTASDFGSTSDTGEVTLAQGQTATQDFTLATVPSRTIGGTVKDGSGNGWPLYAKITVSGYPHGAVFTDPLTGAYSLQLPEDGKAHTLTVTPVDVPGYQPAQDTVTVGDSDVTENFQLPIDATTCAAPGYGWTTVGSFTDFEGWGSAAQDGWSVVNEADDDGAVWTFADPNGWGNMTGGTGNYAIADAVHAVDYSTSTDLVSPVTDLSDNDHPSIQFDSHLPGGLGITASVDVSLDGGATWSTAWHLVTDQSAEGHQAVDLPQAADQPDVQVRFHYQANQGVNRIWELDDVQIGSRTCDPQGGGLVVGDVTDANTGRPVTGATITAQGATTSAGTGVATVEDQSTGAAHYWLYAPAGTAHLGIERGLYTTADASVTVAPGQVVAKDWQLGAGHLVADTTTLSTTAAMGHTTTKQVTVTNDGTSPTTLTVTEGAMASTPMARAALGGAPAAPSAKVRLKDPAAAAHAVRLSDSRTGSAPGSLEGTAATPAASGSAWSAVPDIPDAVGDNAAATLDGKLYSISGVISTGYFTSLSPETYQYDPATQAWARKADFPQPIEAPVAQALDGMIYVFGGWNGDGYATPDLFAYDPTTDSWTQMASAPIPLSQPGSAVLGGKLYVVGGCTTQNCAPASTGTYVYDPSTNSWSRAADFPEAAAFVGCGGIDGEVVCSGGVDAVSGDEYDATWLYNPVTDSWSQGATAPYGVMGSFVSAANGRLQLSDGIVGSFIVNSAIEYDPQTDSWRHLPNSNAALARGGGACGAYTVGGEDGVSTISSTAQVLPGYDQCGEAGQVAWLGESTTQVALAPGQHTTLIVSFDAGQVQQPGDYTSQLLLASPTPYLPPTVRATMHVNAPASWGKVQGTVTDGGTPLAGATVQLCSNYDAAATTCGPLTYTTTTDTAGHYQLWLDQSYSKVRIIVSKDGLGSQMKVAAVRGGVTTSTDFDLDATVNKALPSLTLSVQKQAKATARVTAKVTIAAAGAVPTGTVSFAVAGGGRTRTVRATLVAGAARATLPTLPAGSYRVTASYAGDHSVAGGRSVAGVLKVVKVGSRLTAKLKAAPTTTTARDRLSVSVTAAGVTPTGTVRVTITGGGRTRVLTRRLAHGKVTLQLPKLGTPGTYRIRVAYAGSASVQGHTVTKRLTVRRVAKA